MASLVLGVAGAAVGSMFGPLGASIGWAIGAGIGSALFAKDQQGPRLTDLRLQGSSYGAPIPIGYGMDRQAGVVIWQTDLQETAHESDGKGGPTITTYSYSASFAVMLCEGPISGIRRIWADGRLVYGPGSPGDQLPMVIYRGTDDQLPDPTMEAIEGAGNVPAHRGTAYVVFTDLQLGDYGNRIPNFTFEIRYTGATTLEVYAQWPVDYDYPVNSSAYSYPFLLNGIEQSDEGVILHRYRHGSDYGTEMGTGDASVVYYDRREYTLRGALVTTTTQVQLGLADYTGHVLLGSSNSDIAYVRYQTVIDCSDYDKGLSTTINTFRWLKAGEVTYTPDTPTPEHDFFCNLATEDQFSNWEADYQLPIQGMPILWNGYVYAAGEYDYGTDTAIRVRRWPAPDGAVRTDSFDAVSLDANDLSALTGADSPGDLVLGDDGYLYWLVSFNIAPGDYSQLLRLDSNLNVVAQWSEEFANLPEPGAGAFLITADGYLVGFYNQGIYDLNPQLILYQMNADGTFTWIDEIPPPTIEDSDSPPAESNATPIISLGNGFAAVRGGIIRLGSTQITLGEIVADVSSRMGYATTEYDTSQLTDIVRGYKITQRMSGRAAIDPLRPVYQFGAVESNQAVKFRKWDGTVDATIPDADLGARPVEEDPVEIDEVTRIPEDELPRQIDALYINVGMDYQDGHQIRQRSTAMSELDIAVTMPVVLDDDEAAAATERLLFNAWIERDKFRNQLPRKWSHLEPTDVISVRGRARRIINKEEIGYTHIVLESLATESGVFITAPTSPAPIGFVPQPAPAPNNTDLRLLDLPLLNAQDYANGFYAAVAPQRAAAWQGASIMKSIDGGSNYVQAFATQTACAIGIAETVLGSWGGGNIFDEINTVQVRITPGSPALSSTTRLGVLNGANLAVIGAEVFQFRTATLTEDRVYVLSGLLRGRFGTEWAMDNHTLVSGDFAMLPAINLEGPFAEIGKARLYKGVTSGQSLGSAQALTFTNTGIALKPYAVVNIGGGRNAAGDVTITWQRRTRINGAWMDGADAPLGEASESYVVGIYSSGGTWKRWIYVAAETATYTAAQQVTDFGSTQSTVYARVWQWGSIDYGYVATGTV